MNTEHYKAASERTDADERALIPAFKRTFRDSIAKQCGFGVETQRTADPNERNETGNQQGEAVQVCSAGDWPEDMGGNWTPDRREANIAFSEWLDSRQDAIVPTSMSEWLQQNEDSIFIE